MENKEVAKALESNQTAEVNKDIQKTQQCCGEKLKALARVISRIRESLDLETIFKTTVTELRELLCTDRVAVFRFFPDLDWEGEFVSEDINGVWDSVIHSQVRDCCFGEKFVSLYQQEKISVISDIYQDCSQDCYVELLEKFQIRACITAPLLQGEQLWGLLCVHQCSGIREWLNSEVEFVRQIAEHLGVALQHAELLAQARYQIEQQKALASVIARIRDSLDLQTIFKNTAIEVRNLLKADRVGVFYFDPESDWEGEFVSEDVAPEYDSAMATRIYDHCFGEYFAPQYSNGRINVISDIYSHEYSDCYIKILEKFQVRANVVAPLLKGKELWGLLCIHQCVAPRHWENSEIEFVQQIAGQLSVAIQQAQYLEQTQLQTAQLVEAAERDRAAERQKVVSDTIEKIRRSFDLEQIFQAACQEVRKLLEVDRAVVYRFNPDWSGEFVAESVTEGWTLLVQQQWEQPELRANVSECSLKHLATVPTTDTHLQETEGGNFARGELFRTCHDIYNAGFSDCYVRVLESYQARAYIIIAIYHGQKLWGLLAVFQNSAPRHWQDYEIHLLLQISTQVGVALQQSEYFQQVKAQSAQLEKAANRQRALATTVDKIRQSLDIETIFQTTTQEVRRLLNVDRVAIYRFYPGWSGEFVADSIVDGWMQLGKTQPTTEKPLLEVAKTGKYPRNETFVPILQGEKIWGLLVAYQNSQPRYWEEEEVNLLAQVGVQLGVALQQAETLKQVQAQAAQLARAAEREKALAMTVEKIRQSLDLHVIFATTTQEVRSLLEVERVAIYCFYADGSGEFLAESVAEEWMPLVGNPFLMKNTTIREFQSDLYGQYQTVAVNDIYAQGYSDRQLAFLEQIQAHAYVIVPIFQGEQLWGLLAAYQNGKSRQWLEDEISLLVQIGLQLGVALQQAELLEQTTLQKEKLNQTLKELQETQTQLIQGEKMAGLGQLVAGIAHEINNPINFIYGNLSHVGEYSEHLMRLLNLYQKEFPGTGQEIKALARKIDLDYILEDLPKTLGSMQFGAERILQLVESLQTFSQLDRAEMRLVDIHKGIDSTLLILQHRLRATSTSTTIEVVKQYGKLPHVECYAAQLNQVFMNLLGNAIDAVETKYKEEQLEIPKIVIHTDVLDTKVIRICISDNGCGIPEGLRSRIFDPFFTTKEPGKGTGLGLSISYKIIVDKHGGKIACFSEPGKGTKFVIEIPVKHGC
ncbi:GAF domain-containing protein [Calothrix sp. UHCC 0171]|uniref:GAF domain-containing protein n=1 Tax=Calothrix sp. UHCC 0171 TaxID=3110245 RepID=UPI002B217D05|nr:GAF domain-containing protein [Calothrix sp. UHCC 0171]MEA5570513.1 GAF domain-containing protein [Calothrix sp. UHCC 0171]